MGKQFRDLKGKQKEKIQGWLYEEFCRLGQENGQVPRKPQNNQILAAVYSKILDAQIAISFEEVRKYFNSKVVRFRKKYEREYGPEPD